jgi:zinc transport system substrate-binding protein
MNIRSKLFLGCICLSLAVFLSGCGNGDKLPEQTDGKISVVTSFYPLYYFAKEIGGDRAHVVNLIAAGVEPHEWTPKSRDLDAVSKAQLFLYNGAGLEGWVDDFLHGLGSNSKVLTVEASKGIQLLQGNPEKGQMGEVTPGHSNMNVDPHTWVSPRSALVMAANIRDAYVKVDAGHRKDYETGYAALDKQL